MGDRQQGTPPIGSGNILLAAEMARGEDKAKVRGQGGTTPGERSCSVFEFESDLIARTHIDPDPGYTGRDAEHFLWRRRPQLVAPRSMEERT